MTVGRDCRATVTSRPTVASDDCRLTVARVAVGRPRHSQSALVSFFLSARMAEAGPPAEALPPAPKTMVALIKDALTAAPQTADEVYANMVVLCSGAYALPSLNTVQSALSARGR